MRCAIARIANVMMKCNTHFAEYKACNDCDASKYKCCDEHKAAILKCNDAGNGLVWTC